MTSSRPGAVLIRILGTLLSYRIFKIKKYPYTHGDPTVEPQPLGSGVRAAVTGAPTTGTDSRGFARATCQ